MNYSKFSGRFVCKMAMLLAFMFAACSENNNSVAGGTVEETGVYANLENISIRGMARMAGTSDESRHIVVVGLEAGSNVTLYELNAKTFAKTGVVYTGVVGDGGSFAFENVTLTSPYVLIEAERPAPENAYAYSVFTDVRDSGEINVDVLTHLEALRAVHLAQLGKSFAEAKKQAKTETMEALGIYDASDNIRETDEVEYTAMVHAVSSTLPMNKLSVFPISLPLDNPNINKLFNSIVERGSFLHVDSALDESFVYVVTSGVQGLERSFMVPFEAYEKLGDAWIRDYRVKERMAKYYAGMLSVALGAGRCVQDDEGKVYEKQVFYESGKPRMIASLVCRSGEWNLTVPEIERTMGTMTDARDGKTYKTVTVNVDGVSQTWMAENLKFEGAIGVTCDDDSNFVEGCFYPLLTAMNLDSSYLVFDFEYESMEACREDLARDVSEPYGGIEAYCEESMNPETHAHLDYERLDTSDSAKHQGICPDGWRLPNPHEWEGLMSPLRDRLGENDYENMLYLFNLSPLGDAMGFGLRARYSIMWLGHTPDYVPDPSSGLLSIYGVEFVTAPGKAMRKDDYGHDRYTVIASMVRVLVTKMEFSRDFVRLPVRCIKN